MIKFIIESSFISNEQGENSMAIYLLKIWETIGRYPRVYNMWYRIDNNPEKIFWESKKRDALDFIMILERYLISQYGNRYTKNEIMFDFSFEFIVSNKDWQKLRKKMEYKRDIILDFDNYSVFEIETEDQSFEILRKY